MNYGIGPDINPDQIAGVASNLRSGNNPSYQVADFLVSFPQFGNNSQGVAVVPTMVIQLYVDLAQLSIQQARWRGAWNIAMGFFVAHFCTLWLRASASADDDKDTIISAGEAKGITTSETVDGVSYSMDTASIMQDLNGFAAWKTTEFGIQLATFAKMYGKGGMVIS